MEPSRETTVLFAAIIGAGDLREKAGDKAAHEALERCQFRLGQAAASCGARLMKSTADKVMVLAATPDAAADAASAMHLAMEKLPKTADDQARRSASASTSARWCRRATKCSAIP